MPTSKQPLSDAVYRTAWNCSRFRQFLADRSRFDGTNPLVNVRATERWRKRFAVKWIGADMVMVLYSLDTDMRLALSMSVQSAGPLRAPQVPHAYQLRQVGAYDCQTVLLAPRSLMRDERSTAVTYDIRLPFEEVADFVPDIANALCEEESYAAFQLRFPGEDR